MASRVQCEACRRWMASTSSVAGFGPKCARKRGLTVARLRRAAALIPPPVRPAELAEDQGALFDLAGVANA